LRLSVTNQERREMNATVACKTGFTFTTGTKVLLRHIKQGFFAYV
jgi:hypothetical protein